MLRLALWLVAAVIAARQTALVRPFGGLVLKPLTRAAEQALAWGWTVVTLLLVVALGLVVARALPQPVSRRASLLAAPAAISLLMLSLPVRNALWLGPLGVLPVLLVLAGCFAVRGERTSGVLVGLAAALQPAVLLFAPLLWSRAGDRPPAGRATPGTHARTLPRLRPSGGTLMTPHADPTVDMPQVLAGRRRAAITTGVTFAAGAALAWAVMPRDSYMYWVRHLAGTGLGGKADDLANQSLHGGLLRLSLTGPLEIALFLGLGTAVAVLGVRRAVRYARDGQLLLAVAVTGCTAIAVSPTTWQYQLLWVLLAAVGRVGKRASDRYVWPVTVILVMTLPARILLPNMSQLYTLRDDAVLLAALAAATAVPFLSRTSPYYRTPIPARCGPLVPARWKHVPLVPFLRRVLTRPNLLLELLLTRVTYAAYQQVRLAVTADRATAEHHGRQVHTLERWLSLDLEHWANRTVVRIDWLRGFLDFYYESFHFAVPLTILAVLYVRRPADYRWARSALGLATLFALLGFWLYPLAPPRLMPGLGFVDTVHGVQDFARPDYGTLTGVTNQYAAMPSLHFAWALWCGIVIVALAPRLWLKALGLLHPLFTAAAIVTSANHWVLDAVGGAAVVGAGFGLTYLVSGPRARTATAGRDASPPDALTAGSDRASSGR